MPKIILNINNKNLALAVKNMPDAWVANPEQPEPPTAQDNLTQHLVDYVTNLVKAGKRSEYNQSLDMEIVKLDNSVTVEGAQQ